MSVIELLRTVSKLFIPDQTALLGTGLNLSGIILFAHDFSILSYLVLVYGAIFVNIRSPCYLLSC